MEHISKLNELMSVYAGLLSKIDSIKTQFKDKDDELVKSAVRVLEETLLASVRDKHMDIQTEFHSFLNQFNA